MSEETIHKLSMDEAAVTAYRAFACALGQEPQDWDGLSFEAQSPWLRLAKRAEAVLAAAEGSSFAEVTQKIQAAASGAAPAADARTTFAWEAVARHLYAIIDEYDIPDLLALERSWGPWVQSRLEKACPTS